MLPRNASLRLPTIQPAVIFMTGDLLDSTAPGTGVPRHLQKPFRISEVLAIFQEILSSTPLEKVSH